ncbi:MAG: hypothetical protein ACK5JT_23700 [Hyphomicrobiaceae bacterium]
MVEVPGAHREKPLIVKSHVTPWGFLVALPLAVAFAWVGAMSLDTPIATPQLGVIGSAPPWIVSAALLGFSLLLFIIGIAELAAYIKPAVQVVFESEQVRTLGVMGERRFAWNDVVAARIDDGQLVLSVRGRTPGKIREARLHFSRLQIDPAVLIRRILTHRPDIRIEQRTS